MSSGHAGEAAPAPSRRRVGAQRAVRAVWRGTEARRGVAHRRKGRRGGASRAEREAGRGRGAGGAASARLLDASRALGYEGGHSRVTDIQPLHERMFEPKPYFLSTFRDRQVFI